ncbi:hypothetical protein NVP1271B_05 [Vibrio phage 1.271.B._10N.286.54.B4]|nr:hypothetical protein NVP1027O_05 [Vibrio phage 1.027.O._10N.286.54.B8]AUR92332.1 hypothetical protein NVP1171O_05 [Vibrio phage 1.171.O._10N.261.52.F12]AUR94385.1 hypothetical protein NVP1194O_05 [Vibrio phage 1.194.O._10N.286.54.B1]AUR94470.1 hypothetical protein NVP1195O_05 [Vibrio phage 1.195.O._10N.286.54.C8]AUR94558.1 hypothetical protein NVP1196O_05 [Vibrio phage 1.196.O._10N.286.54.E12]AUR95025.1 hypothetical protein NVP1200O_05 [Vibrio phage 1.200.O._10N.286.55.E1]AUR99513.1 hypoth
MVGLEQAALHSRVVENRLRKDFRQFAPILEIELSVEGFIVKAVAGDEMLAFSDRRVVPFDCAECLVGVIDESEHRMRGKMSPHV